MLALETINIPDGALDGVHQDILLVLDAIASQRGLAGLAVISGIGTWNYPNERLVTASRRHRQGRDPGQGPQAQPRQGVGHEHGQGEQQQPERARLGWRL